jgi:hypothetical protein
MSEHSYNLWLIYNNVLKYVAGIRIRGGGGGEGGVGVGVRKFTKEASNVCCVHIWSNSLIWQLVNTPWEIPPLTHE